MIQTCEQEKIKDKTGRDAHGRWVKGFCPNPKGRGSFVDDLIDALQNESQRQGYKNFAEVVAKRALQYETVLIAVLKKVCPDKIEHSGKVTLTQEEKDARFNRLKDLGVLPLN